MAAYFTSRTLAFLRALKRNNNRDWFKAHLNEYEAHVRGPMLAVIERLASDLPAFAPDLVASPRESLFRIYRDTRFSADKRPLKTHVAASFSSRRLPRRAGAGLYFHLDPNTDQEVWIGGGTYAPEPHELTRIREHIAAHHVRFRALVESPAFKRSVGRLEGVQLTRVPRGYPPDHPAAGYLRFKQLYAGKSYDVAFATSPRFYHELIKVFRVMAPLVAFLNEALIGAYRAPRVDPDRRTPTRLGRRQPPASAPYQPKNRVVAR
jgi:uncharacterized protein (TIGR02453 family)